MFMGSTTTTHHPTTGSVKSGTHRHIYSEVHGHRHYLDNTFRHILLTGRRSLASEPAEHPVTHAAYASLNQAGLRLSW